MFNIRGKKCKFWVGDKKVKKIYLGAQKVFSAGNLVTYKVDTNYTRTEEWDEGLSVLTPATFTPTKPGWIFHGWKETLEAVSTILSSKIMGDDPITLYGVFKKLVTLTLYNNSTTAEKEKKTGYRYYNNENITDPSFTVTPDTKNGWTFLGWTKSTSADGDIEYASITNRKFSTDETLYGKYSKNVILSYDGNGATGGSTSSQTSAAYYNSSNNTLNPTFSIKNNGFTKTDHSFLGWGLNSIDGDQYSPGSLLTLDSDAKLYALWDLIRLVVYDVTYTRGSIAWEPSVTVNVNNTTYIGSTKTIYGSVPGDSSFETESDYNDYNSGNVTILSLKEAAKEFKYADVTIEHVSWTDGGGYSAIYLDGTRIDGATKELCHKTYTWDLSKKTSCTVLLDVRNWSNNPAYWAGGSIGVKSVILRK